MRAKDISSFGEGSLRTYVIGFSLSIILTIIPFALIMNHAMTRSAVVITIILFAITQIIVHLVCFLHLKLSSDQSWNWLAFIYTLILLIALVGGSTWIIYNLNHNMMVMQRVN